MKWIAGMAVISVTKSLAILFDNPMSSTKSSFEIAFNKKGLLVTSRDWLTVPRSKAGVLNERDELSLQ